MLLQEIIEDVGKLKPCHVLNELGVSREELSGLTGNEALRIVVNAAQTQALEEMLICLTDRQIPGSSYQIVINKARELDFSPSDIAALEAFKPHSLFFISALGTPLDNSATTFFSTKYFKDKGRNAPEDKDIFWSYYRTSSGTIIGLGNFSALNFDPRRDMPTEILKNALGAKDAHSKTMVGHAEDKRLGFIAETSMIGVYSDIAASMAIGLGPLMSTDKMPYAHDSVVHLFLGDSGVNQPNFRTAYSLINNHVYLMARHFLKLSDSEIKEARKDYNKRFEIYKRLIGEGLVIRFATHIYDNGVGISCPTDISSPFGDPLDSIRHLQEKGLIQILEYDSSDFPGVLKNAGLIDRAARESGLVASIVNVPRPGGHSLSSYAGLAKIGESRIYSPMPTLTLKEAMQHNNFDPILNALNYLVESGYIGPSSAQKIILDAQREMIERLIELVKCNGIKPNTSHDLNPVMAYEVCNTDARWAELINSDGYSTRRDGLWKSHAHMRNISIVPKLRTQHLENKVKEGAYLPEHLEFISPLQAENLSLAEIMMIYNGRFLFTGQDVPDSSPFKLDNVLNALGLRYQGQGGIDRATAMLQVLAHNIDPQRGRFRFMDIGINEPGIYSMIAGLKHANGGNAAVFGEIQFMDYDPRYGLEHISSLFQRSNGRDNIPVVIRMSYGCMRTGNAEEFFEKSGAAGMYHSGSYIGSLAGQFPGIGIVAPNTARAVQMAYRNAIAGETPTVILMSSPVMNMLKVADFDYTGAYLPLDASLDPAGTSYIHRMKDENKRPLPIGAHEKVILTYGEGVFASKLAAKELKEKHGINTLIVDYNYAVPRDTKAVQKLLELYSGSGITPVFAIVSFEDEFGFGAAIQNDLTENISRLEQYRIDHIRKAPRKNGNLQEHLVFPNPGNIALHLLENDPDRKREYSFQNYKPKGSMKSNSNFVFC